ncbi:MAG: hypothetical protein WDN69_15900 [Aliidongia sp.]
MVSSSGIAHLRVATTTAPVGGIFGRQLPRDHHGHGHGDQHGREDYPAPAPEPGGQAEHAQWAGSCRIGSISGIRWSTECDGR